jgi:hypothetical protein
MQIVLGVFHSSTFELLLGTSPFNYNKSLSNENVDVFPFDKLNKLGKYNPTYESSCWVRNLVGSAMYSCNLINFILDDVKLPLNNVRSVTCKELNILLEDQELIDKTVFWLEGKVIETKKVLDIIQKVKEDELKFEDINF